MPASRKKIKAISPAGLSVVLAGCGVAVYCLLPSKRELLERQLHDGNYKSAAITFKEIPWYDRARDRGFYDLVELQIARRSLRPDRALEMETELDAAWQVAARHNFNPDFVKEILIILNLHPRSERAWALAEPWAAKLHGVQREELIDLFVKRFLADDKPGRALDIYQPYFTSVLATEPRTLEMIRLFRLSGHSQEALDVFEKNIKIKTDTLTENNIRLLKLQIDLLRENNRPEDAFQVVKNLFHQSSLTEQQKLFELLIATAEQSNHSPEVLGEMQTRAEAEPDNKKLWVLFANTATAANKTDIAVSAWQKIIKGDPENGEFRFKLGQVYEWSDQPENAFDTYLEALRLKYADAVERLVDLNPGLYRDVELAQALEDVPEIIHQKHFELNLARIENKIGNFEIAKKWYEDALSLSPKDTSILQEYAGLLLSLFDYEKALEVYTQARKLNPDDTDIIRGLSETYLHLNRYEDAYHLLEVVVDKTNDPEVLEDWVHLAENMGKMDGVLKGLYKKIASPSVTPSEYLNLGYFLYIKGDNLECYRILKLGLAKFPKDDPIRFQVANLMRERKDYLESANVLEASPTLLQNNPAAIELYASMLIQSQKFKEANEFIRDKVPQKLRDTEAFTVFRASVAEALDKAGEATQLFHGLYAAKPSNPYYALNYARLLGTLGKVKEAKLVLAPFLADPSPEVLKLTAEVLAAGHEYREAEHWQQMFIDTQPAEIHKAYGFLGDVLLSRGDKVNARAAYRQALDSLLNDTARRNNLKKPAKASPEPLTEARAAAQP